jgi:hypothetical protein
VFILSLYGDVRIFAKWGDLVLRDNNYINMTEYNIETSERSPENPNVRIKINGLQEIGTGLFLLILNLN